MHSYGWRWTRTLVVAMELSIAAGSSGLIREILCIQGSSESTWRTFYESQRIHADPFTSEWLRDLGLPATSGHTPGRNKE